MDWGIALQAWPPERGRTGRVVARARVTMNGQAPMQAIGCDGPSGATAAPPQPGREQLVGTVIQDSAGRRPPSASATPGHLRETESRRG
jgi:hypothetical protein